MGVTVHAYNPTLRTLRWEEHLFKVSLGCVVSTTFVRVTERDSISTKQNSNKKMHKNVSDEQKVPFNFFY